jgi:hypothetical protein
MYIIKHDGDWIVCENYGILKENMDDICERCNFLDIVLSDLKVYKAEEFNIRNLID